MSSTVINAIRGEVLSGRPLLVLEPHANSGSALSQAARNACHVAGRMADLVTIDGTPHMPESALCRDPSRRRVDLKSLASLPMGSLYDTFQACAFGNWAQTRKRTGKRDPFSRFDRTAAFDPGPYNPLPVVPLNAFRKSRAVVVIRGGWREMMALAWGFVVTMGVETSPLIAANGLNLSYLVEPLGLGHAGLANDGERSTPSFVTRPAAVEAVLADDGRRWDKARSAIVAAAAIEAGSGYALARGEGAIACAALAISEAGREEVFLVRTDAAGWCEGAWLRYERAPRSPMSGDVLAELSAMALGGGVRAIVDWGEKERLGHSVRRMSLDPVSDIETAEYLPAPVTDALMGAVDGALVRACLSTTDPAVTYDWVATSTRRRQFALGTPAFLPYAMETAVSETVDAADPLAPLLSEKLGLSRGLIRRLAGATVLPGEVPACSPRYRQNVRFDYSLPVLRSLGAAHVPSAMDVAEWKALCDSVDAVEAAHIPHDAVARMLVDLGPDWASRHAAIMCLGAHAVTDIADMVRTLTVFLERIDRRQPLDPSEVCRMLAGHGSLKRLCRVSARWHGHPVLARSSGSLPANTTWPVPFRTLDLGEGWSATCIGLAQALYDEGSATEDADGLAGLDHCVATYAAACQTGASLVVSLRVSDAQGTRRMSTIEFRPTKARAGNWSFRGTPMEMVQHRARDNAEPSAETNAALDRLRSLLTDRDTVIDRTALSPRPPASVAALPERDMELYEMWRPFFPKRHSRLSPEALIDVIHAQRRAFLTQFQAPERRSA